VEKIGEGERRDARLERSTLGLREKSRGMGVKRIATRQKVEDDVGVDENRPFHRYFSVLTGTFSIFTQISLAGRRAVTRTG